MSAQYEILPPGGHETYAEKIFTKIKSLFDTKVKTDVPANAVFTDTLTTAYCNTAASTITKIAQCTNFSLTNNSYITINFVNGNTVTADSGVTLNINNTGAKPLYVDWSYEGARAYDQPFDAGIYILYYTNNAYYLYTDGQIYQYRGVAYQDNLKYYNFTSSDSSIDINESTGALIGHPTYYTEDLSVKKVNGHTVNSDVPSNAVFTDNLVQQSPNSSTDAEYRILFSNTADDTERTEKVQKNSNFSFNPLTDTLKIGRAFSISGVTGTRDTSIDVRGIKISEYVGDSLYGRLELQYRDIFLDATWDGTNTSLKDAITYLNSQSAANKVDKAGDTMTGTLLRTTVDGAAWHAARDHAFIRSHGFANNGSWFPALSFLTTGGSWAIGSLSNSNNFWFSYTRNNEYTNNINKTDNYQLVPVNDGNAHTYTIAHSGNVGTGDSNGQVKIAGTNVGVKGLGSAAYYNAASTNTASTVVVRDANRYIYAQYYNAGCGAETPSSSSYIVYSNSDGWFRKSTIANMKTAMSLSNYTNGTISGATSTTSHLAIGGILRAGYHSRTDTGDSGYMNFVNYSNNAYAPIRASGFTTMSSKHMKTNIQDISDEDAKKLLDIRPINFDYVEEVGGLKNQIGVLAEDTYKILPKVVSVPDDYVEEDFDISKGIHQSLPSVDYAKFVPYLIKMVQMQQKEINELKTSLNNFMQLA